MTTDVKEALAFTPPPREKVEQSLGLLRRYFAPETIGIENVQVGRPTLFVGNHTRFGVIDVPLITREIYLHTGTFPRSMADRVHYRVPLWKDLIGRSGGVLGSREMCRALMRAGESILVYPGGAREVFKGKGKDYQLLWQNRLGFVRMAVENGYSITPFCSVGADEIFDIVIGGDEILHSPVGKFFGRLLREKQLPREDLLLPLPRGIGLSVIPRPEKFYFAFGRPIETTRYAGRAGDTAVLRRIRKQTATSIEHLLAETMLHRAQHRDGISVWRKVLQKT